MAASPLFSVGSCRLAPRSDGVRPDDPAPHGWRCLAGARGRTTTPRASVKRITAPRWGSEGPRPGHRPCRRGGKTLDRGVENEQPRDGNEGVRGRRHARRAADARPGTDPRQAQEHDSSDQLPAPRSNKVGETMLTSHQASPAQRDEIPPAFGTRASARSSQQMPLTAFYRTSLQRNAPGEATLVPFKTVVGEFQRSAVFRHHAYDLIGHAPRNCDVDLQRHRDLGVRKRREMR